MNNPVASWPTRHLVIAVLLLADLVVAGGGWIQCTDRDLLANGLERSSKLEWVGDAAVAKTIVDGYRGRDGDHEPRHARDRTSEVTRGMLIDTFVFIPGYVSLLVLACSWAARALVGSWTRRGLVMARAAIIAGALDLVENTGILLEVNRDWTALAPLTHLACLGKWTLAGGSALFALGTLVAYACAGRRLRALRT